MLEIQKHRFFEMKMNKNTKILRLSSFKIYIHISLWFDEKLTIFTGFLSTA